VSKYLPEIYLFSTVLILLLLLFFLKPALLPFFIASVFAYISLPIFDFFHQITGKRRISALLTIFTLFLIFLVGLFVVLPTVIEQIQSFINYLPILVHKLDSFFYSHFGKHWSIFHPFKIKNLAEFLQEIYSKLGTLPIGSIISKLFSGVFSVISIAINIVVVPFLTYYLLIDSQKILDIYISLSPDSIQDELEELLNKVHSALSSYLIGQMAVATFVGAYIAIGLYFVGIKYSLLIGFVAGVLNMIPYVGFFSGLLPSLLLAVFDNGSVEAVLGVLTVFLTEVGLENLIYPLVMSRTTGVNPLLILLFIFLGGYLGGILGIIVAVPLAVILIPICESFLRKKRGIGVDSRDNG